MRLGIGIDTGGTCTDAVLYDYDSKKVISFAKALTTRENLTAGIQNALNQLPADLVSQAQTLALSTTLATNACVEDKGGRARLILYGADAPYVMRVIGKNGSISEEDLICFDSQTTTDGEIRNMPDWSQMQSWLSKELENCQAAAVVEIYSRKTGAKLEQKTRDLLLQSTDLPVVCGYELFHELDFIKRGASCLLNARLIPLIDSFLKAIDQAASQKQIPCSPVIVRSDGSLMSREFAKFRPVETLLCGPVASLMGAQELADVQDAVIIDMGGTTTDVAFLDKGQPRRVNGGITIGHWKTFVKGLFVDTFALGGDSGIRYRMNRGLYLDDRRVIPLCVFAQKYPFIKEELRTLAEQEIVSTRSIYEFYELIQDIDNLPGFDDQERAICQALKQGPLPMLKLCEKVHCAVYDLDTTHLESENIIMRAGLTPTDVMHVTGDYTAFDAEASAYGLRIAAACAERNPEHLAEELYDLVKEKLYFQLARILLEQQYAWVKREGLSPQLTALITESFKQFKKGNRQANLLTSMFHSGYTFIGIGGPIHIFLKDVAEAFGSKAVIPPCAAVANAVGAAVCQVSFTVSAHITPSYNSCGGVIHYTVSAPGSVCEFLPEELEAAKQLAKEEAIRCAKEEAIKRGLSAVPDIQLIEKELYFSGFNAVSDIIVEASV